MRALILLLTLGLTACVKHPLATVTPPMESPAQFALIFQGSTMAGMAAVKTTDTEVLLDVMTPMGTGLFKVHTTGETQAVTALATQMEAALAHIPFYRDLPLLYRYRCPAGTCQTPNGRLTRVVKDDGVELQWQGKGGPVSVMFRGDQATLIDTRRGYTLKIIGGLPDA